MQDSSHPSKPVPILLLLAMLFSVRHLVIVFLAYNPSPKIAVAFLQGFHSPLYLATDIPSLLVLCSWFRRLPKSGAFWRIIWRHGRALLTMSLSLQFGLLYMQHGQELWQAYSFTDSQRFVIVNLGLDLLVIYYLWRFTIVRDVFADFPSASPKATDQP